MKAKDVRNEAFKRQESDLDILKTQVKELQAHIDEIRGERINWYPSMRMDDYENEFDRLQREAEDVISNIGNNLEVSKQEAKPTPKKMKPSLSKANILAIEELTAKLEQRVEAIKDNSLEINQIMRDSIASLMGRVESLESVEFNVQKEIGL